MSVGSGRMGQRIADLSCTSRTPSPTSASVEMITVAVLLSSSHEDGEISAIR
jgi:hypothetical protein